MTIRIKDHGGGLIEEVIAPAVWLRWDAVTNTGQVEFRTVSLVTLNGQSLASKDAPSVTITIDPENPRVFEIPTGEVDELEQPITVQIDTNLIMATFKVAFDQIYNEVYGVTEEETPDGGEPV